MVAGAGVAVQVGNVIDLMGSGVGTAPPNIIGVATPFGQDPGAGLIKPRIRTIVGTAFTTSNSATLNLQLQYAADSGTPTYVPGTWQTAVETGTIAASALTANANLPELEFEPSIFTLVPRPRFIRVNGLIASATNFTAGTISFCAALIGADVFSQKQATRNYAV